MFRLISVLYKSSEDIDPLLESIKQHVKAPCEILLWDNGNDQETVDRFLLANSDYPHPIVYHRSEENIGFARAVNSATKANTGRDIDAFLVLNPDSVFLSDVKEENLQRLSKLEAVIGLRVFDDLLKLKRQASARSFPSLVTAFFNRKSLLTRLWRSNPWSKKYLGTELRGDGEQEVDWVSGSAFFVPRRVWKKLGGYDERYFMFVEDTDLGRIAKERNIKCFFSPSIDVCHYIGGSSKSTFKVDLYHHSGMWKYYWKWTKGFRLLLAPLVFAGIVFRFFLKRLK